MFSSLPNVETVLELTARALRENAISEDDARFLSNCAGDFTTLEHLHAARMKRLGGNPGPLVNLPDIRVLMHYLQRADYISAMREARDVCAGMKPLLLHAGELLRRGAPQAARFTPS